MNILLVSECSKAALAETRRILDQYAERKGERTWQTPITQKGLETLHKVLRKTARKNTAVACHWLRGRNHTELLWIVGSATRFNHEGSVPTNWTARDVLRSKDENDWHTAYAIRLLAELAALFHDFGKSMLSFALKLLGRGPVADAYRHEWVSLRMFEAFVAGRSDEEWITDLASEKTCEKWLENIVRDGIDLDTNGPFSKGRLGPLAQIVGWLVVSHHRLPAQHGTPVAGKLLQHLPKPIGPAWNGARTGATDEEKNRCWTFEHGSPMASQQWRRSASKVAKRIQARDEFLRIDWLQNRYVSHLARLSLMLADHYYSGLPAMPLGDRDFPLYANTDRKTRKPNQRLDEHLIGVANAGAKVSRTLPRLGDLLPRIGRHTGFTRRTKDARFRWQNQAYDLAVSLHVRSEQYGFFGVNMASTGAGKTLANGRIMYGLADPKRGARFSIALGLRTLTLQTGQSYRENLRLTDDDLAVMIGSSAVRELFELNAESHPSAASQTGSESAEDLIADSIHVHYEGALPHGGLSEWLQRSPQALRLLSAPILVSTVDHLVPATEGTRGGRQIAPMLRLLTSDLVLDEPDDFDLDDLPALTRLVHWAGLLGSRVLLSSATLPPALTQGLFAAYRAGRRSFLENRGIPGVGGGVWCGWFDEFGCTASENDSQEDYAQAHIDFVKRRIERLEKKEVRRVAQIAGLKIQAGSDAVRESLAGEFHRHALHLHDQHAFTDPRSDKRVSFGLIRMANIDPIIDVARALLCRDSPPDCRMHICVYHSRHPLLVRSRMERELDQLLSRSRDLKEYADSHFFRHYLDAAAERDQLFIVLASPVAEVGRDHDYDWAVVEPSSMRSIIQLSGRVRRHRIGAVKEPNILLLETNLKHLEGKQIAYRLPGFESTDFKLKHHQLTQLLTDEQVNQIDSRPRILQRSTMNPAENLVDLEHTRMEGLMMGDGPGSVGRWWRTPAALSGELQREKPFRRTTENTEEFILTVEEGGGSPIFNRRGQDGELVPCNSEFGNLAVRHGAGKATWANMDFASALQELADDLDIDTQRCARRFGSVTLPEHTMGWLYNPFLGFQRNR